MLDQPFEKQNIIQQVQVRRKSEPNHLCQRGLGQ